MSHPHRGKGVTVPTLEEVYREFPEVPFNVEIKSEGRPEAVEKVWRVIKEAGAEERTLVVSQDNGVIRRFRRITGGKVATASSTPEMVIFDLLSRVGLSGLLRPRYQALQGPEDLSFLHVVTPGFVRAARELGIREDVWTIDLEVDMRRLLGYGVDGIMTDRTSWRGCYRERASKAPALPLGTSEGPDPDRDRRSQTYATVDWTLLSSTRRIVRRLA